MRISLLTPFRRPWPISAAAAGGTYEWKTMVPDWPTDIFSKKLPDGRSEISMAGVAPAVISPKLSRTRSNYQCWQILRLLDTYGKWFARQHGLRLPVKTGRFVECGEVFVFEDEADPYTFAQLRIPRRIVVSREAG